MSSILLKNCILDGKQTHIYIEGCDITEIGVVREADYVLDVSGQVALPSFANMHTHAAMTLLRGYADDMLLQNWLDDKIWPLEANLKAEDVHIGAKLACLEMIKTGTTLFNDQYFFMEETARAVDEMGLRAILAYGFIDLFDDDKREKEIAATQKFVQHVKGMRSDRIKAATGPHAIYTVSQEGLEWCKHYSDEQEIHMHIHLSETSKEVEDCLDANGVRPAYYLDLLGCLDRNVITAHNVWLSDNEVELMALNGATAAHCPVSNMKLGVASQMPYTKMKDAGLRVTLATDGAASNNNLDMREEMKFAALLHKMPGDPTVMAAPEALAVATEAGFQAAGVDAGKVEVGRKADLILLDRKQYFSAPGFNAMSDWVYAANSSCITTTICNGRLLMVNGKVEGEEQIIADARKAAHSLVSKGE
jgi:5-methylthioadenosine/S-adenosylhomocysteine deaminase